MVGGRNFESVLARFGGPGGARSSKRMSSSRLSRKGLQTLLSKKGALMKARRDSADAATIAADQLAVAEQRFKAAREAHEELVHNHDTTLRSKADSLGKGAAAHLDHPALESIRDLRLFSTTPAKTALISRCACVLVRVLACVETDAHAHVCSSLPLMTRLRCLYWWQLAALSPPPSTNAASATGDDTIATADASTSSALPTLIATPREPLTALQCVRTPKALMRLADAHVFAMLGRKDLRHLVSQCRLERLVGTPELAALVARTGGDFASAVTGAERAASLISEPSPSLSRRKQAGAATSLFKKVKNAKALLGRAGGKGSSGAAARPPGAAGR